MSSTNHTIETAEEENPDIWLSRAIDLIFQNQEFDPQLDFPMSSNTEVSVTASSGASIPSFCKQGTPQGTRNFSYLESHTRTSFVGGHRNSPTSPTKYVSWGINWFEPTFMCLMLLLGACLSLGHHLYYNSLNGTVAGDPSRQSWAIQFGNTFAFLIVACFKAATVSALGQYVWMVVKSRSFTMGSLDKLYTLTTTPLSIFSLSIFRDAKIAAIIAIIFWSMDLIGLAPAATLSVVPRNITAHVAVPSFRTDLGVLEPQGYAWQEISRIVQQSFSNLNIVPLPAPVESQEWTYNISFFGPSLQCRPANSVEEPSFDKFATRNMMDGHLFIVSQMNGTYWNDTSNMPAADANLTDAAYQDLVYNYTHSLLFYTSSTPYVTYDPDSLFDDSSPSIYVQTSTSSIVCFSVNASFDITIASSMGYQSISQNSVQYYNTSWPSRLDDPQFQDALHFYHFGDLSNTLNQIVSVIEIGDGSGSADDTYQDSFFYACDDSQNSPRTYYLTYQAPYPIALPQTQSWQCRNRTISQGIQDLANNITIGFLSSPALSDTNTTFRDVTTSNTINIYVYHPLHLVLSYTIGFLLAFSAIVTGLYSIRLNGLSHANVFSSIVATTRNPDIDELMEGASLGAAPLVENIKKTRLRFGVLNERGGESTKRGCRSRDGEAFHVAFGLEGTVGELKRGGMYT